MNLVLLFLVGAAAGSEQPSAQPFPLWDGNEPVAEYARHVNLPRTRALDLGGGVKLEMVLVPAGKFVMGTPEPPPLDETPFRNQISRGQTLLAVSSGVLLLLLCVVVYRSILQRRKIKFSLLWLLIATVVAGGAVLSALHVHKWDRLLEEARAEAAAAQARYLVGRDDEKPAQEVTLTRAYYMGKFPVTQEQWQQYMGGNPSHFKGKNNPVEMVNWLDAESFCEKLRLQTNEMIRLPSQAEWEFACRAGTRSEYYSGDSVQDLWRAGWFKDNAVNATHAVGLKESNWFGLYDMHGNVWQWCEDLYSRKHVSNSEERAMRGGSFRSGEVACRSACRSSGLPGAHHEYFGFRVVMAAQPRGQE